MTFPNNPDETDPNSHRPDDSDSGNLPQYGPADELAASVLETSGNSEQALGPQNGIRIEPSAADKRRAADILLVHALLKQAFNPQPAQREARIQRAMSTLVALDSGVPVESHASVVMPFYAQYLPRRRYRAVWITAMAIIIAVGFLFQFPDQSRQAQAAVEFIRQVAAQPTDREYQVTLTFAPLQDLEKALPRKPLVGDLFVRGGEAFAFRTPALLGPGKIWMGGDSKGVWLKPARGPIVVEASAEGVLQRYLRMPVETPFLQITSVLERLEKNYDIEMMPDEIPPEDSIPEAGLCRHIRGKRRDPKGAIPSTIDVWAARQGGNVIHLVLEWERNSGPRLLQVKFNFIKQGELPSDWYRPEGHPR